MCACAHGVHFDWDLGREKTTQPAVLTAGPAEAMFLEETAALALAARGRTELNTQSPPMAWIAGDWGPQTKD